MSFQITTHRSSLFPVCNTIVPAHHSSSQASPTESCCLVFAGARGQRVKGGKGGKPILAIAKSKLATRLDDYGKDLSRELENDFGRHLRVEGDEFTLGAAQRWAIYAICSLIDGFRFQQPRHRGDATKDPLWIPVNQALTAWCLWKDPTLTEAELREETIAAAIAAWIAKPGAEALR